MSTRSRAASKSSACTSCVAAPHGEQRGLVHEVGEVGAAHAGRAAGDDVDVDVGRDLLVAEVHLEDRRRARPGSGSGTTIWRSKRPGRSSAGSSTSGRLVAAIITMPSVASKPSISASIWLSVCSRSSWPPPSPAPRLRPMESISSTKMIAGACLRAVCEQVAHPGRADADEHLHEVGAGDRDERHAGLAGDGPGDERLAGARRADEQHALGDARADLLELAGMLEEVDDLGDLLLHRPVAGDVGEASSGSRCCTPSPGCGRCS